MTSNAASEEKRYQALWSIDKFFPDHKMLYEDLRLKWVHEDDLINQRVTWLLQSQGFLLAAFGVIAKWEPSTTSDPPLTGVELIIPVVAVAISIFLRDALDAAYRAMIIIKKRAEQFQGDGRISPLVTVDVLNTLTERGAMNARRLSEIFVLLWLVLEAVEIYRIL